jgi:hypothetical protein
MRVEKQEALGLKRSSRFQFIKNQLGVRQPNLPLLRRLVLAVRVEFVDIKT